MHVRQECLVFPKVKVLVAGLPGMDHSGNVVDAVVKLVRMIGRLLSNDRRVCESSCLSMCDVEAKLGRFLGRKWRCDKVRIFVTVGR